MVASVRRWGGLSNLGKSLMAATRELVATDRYKLEFRLKEPFATSGHRPGAQQSRLRDLSEVRDRGERIRVPEDLRGHRALPVRGAPGRPLHPASKRYDAYVSPPGPPNGYGGRKFQYLDQIDFIPVPDEAARLAGLRAGDFHYLERFSTDQYETLKSERNIAAQVLPPVEWPVFIVNTKTGPSPYPDLARHSRRPWTTRRSCRPGTARGSIASIPP